MTPWLDQLGRLTGEEVYHLAGQLARAGRVSLLEAGAARRNSKRRQRHTDTALELAEVLDDVHAQAARITVPMTEATAIITRARFARGHPVRVVPPNQ